MRMTPERLDEAIKYATKLRDQYQKEVDDPVHMPYTVEDYKEKVKAMNTLLICAITYTCSEDYRHDNY